MNTAAVTIRPAGPADAAAIARIYNHYVEHSCITFETEPVGARAMAARIAETAGLTLPWLVALQDGELLGYAHASRWKGRCAYRYSVESSVYVDPAHAGRGIGRQLYTALLEAIGAAGMHTVIAGIALPNDASVRLHERLGFAPVGRFAQVGHKLGRWVDVGYWQLLLRDTNAAASAIATPSAAATQNGAGDHQPNSTPATPADAE